jgi:adenylate cyclase
MSGLILVVDDEPDLETLVRQQFRRQIRDGAMRFLFARDGFEALGLLAGGDAVDMVISDINMPRMDGLTLLQNLQDKAEELSTIIVSAYGDMANIRAAMNRGAFDFLTKPIDFADLETTIAKTLGHREILREARRRQVEAERAHASLSRFFSPRIAERLAAADAGSGGLAGERREVATLFTDIAGFTSLAESLDPAVLTRLLNEYLGGMTDIVFAYDGTVAKIVGDALHILFGAPADQPDHAARAIRCALDLDEFAEAFRHGWKANGISLGVTRIGVHAGPAIVGSFGGGRFFDYTAYGDTINIAARLEAANKPLGTRVCASETVIRGLSGIEARPIGDLVLRGRGEPLRAYEPIRADRGDGAFLESYARAYALLEQGDPSALAAFAATVAQRPDDPLAGFHLKRLLNGAAGVRIALN